MEEQVDNGRDKRQGNGCRMEAASHRFSVAPMLDYTDRHFRVLMRQITGHSLLYTEMVVAQALHHARQEPGAERPGGRLERLVGFDACERPLALQVGGDDPALLADASRLAADWGYDEVNLNVGCPSEKVRKGRFGACLMAEPAQVARCVAAMAAASPLPVTVKHRIGIDDRDSYAELLAFVDTLAAAGCQRFAVHARKAWLAGLDPKQNRTIPPLRHDLVHRLKAERPELTIELNGGLQTLADCLGQLERVDGVMVGRAVYDHPLRWAAVDRAIHGDSSVPESEDHRAMAARVVRGLIPYAGRWLGRGDRLWPIARHLVKLVEGVPGARHWRQQVSRAAVDRLAGVEVLEQAARLLEQAQPSAPP
jgi:tRNA-dihydrouridine synthase A